MTDYTYQISREVNGSTHHPIKYTLSNFEDTITMNNSHNVTSGMYLTTYFANEEKRNESKMKPKSSYIKVKPLYVFDSELDLEDSFQSGLTLESTSVGSETSIASASTSVDIDDSKNNYTSKKLRIQTSTLMKSDAHGGHKNKNSHKYWRSSYGNCNTICKRITRRPTISVPRQRSLRDVAIPESIAAEFDANSMLRLSSSCADIIYDSTDDHSDDAFSFSSVSYSSSANPWKNSAAVSRSSVTRDDDDETEGHSSVKTVISKISTRILELPRDVEFDSSCDSSSSTDDVDDDDDDLSTDYIRCLDTDYQQSRYW